MNGFLYLSEILAYFLGNLGDIINYICHICSNQGTYFHQLSKLMGTSKTSYLLRLPLLKKGTYFHLFEETSSMDGSNY